MSGRQLKTITRLSCLAVPERKDLETSKNLNLQNSTIFRSRRPDYFPTIFHVQRDLWRTKQVANPPFKRLGLFTDMTVCTQFSVQWESTFAIGLHYTWSTVPHTCVHGNGLIWNNLSQSIYFECNSIVQKSKRIQLTLTSSVSCAKCFIPQKMISLIHDLQAIDTGPEEGVCTDVLSQCSVALNTAHASDWTLRRNGLCCITTLPIYPPPVVNHVSIESETGQAKLWRKAHTSHAKWLWCSSWQW